MNKEDGKHGLHIVKDLPLETPPATPFGRLRNLIETGGEIKLDDLKSSFGKGEITNEEYLQLLEMNTEKNEAEKQALEGKLGIDSLTGLPNEPKQHLEKLIEELNFPHNQREPTLSAVVVAFIDLNRFKLLNDTYGHKVGDEALRDFAEKLKEVIKEGTDLIFRPHGDEFVIVFPIKNNRNVSDEVLERLIRRLQNRVDASFPKMGEVGAKFSLSTSVGYTVLRKGEKPKTAEELLHEADMKMYENKKDNGAR